MFILLNEPKMSSFHFFLIQNYFNRRNGRQVNLVLIL